MSMDGAFDWAGVGSVRGAACRRRKKRRYFDGGLRPTRGDMMKRFKPIEWQIENFKRSMHKLSGLDGTSILMREALWNSVVEGHPVEYELDPVSLGVFGEGFVEEILIDGTGSIDSLCKPRVFGGGGGDDSGIASSNAGGNGVGPSGYQSDHDHSTAGDDDDAVFSLTRDAPGDLVEDGSDGGFSGDEPVVPVLLRFYSDVCDNCHRKQDRSIYSPGAVRLTNVRVPKGAFLRRFATMTYLEARQAAATSSHRVCKDDHLTLKLCGQCRQTLTKVPSAATEKDAWPAMMWIWLTDKKLLQRYGSSMWRVVPSAWRRWWCSVIQECCPIYVGVDLESVPPVFVDVTERRHDLQNGIRSMRASEIKRVCNEHLFSLVRCPWGCSDYFNTGGTLPLDAVVRHLFGKSVKCISGAASVMHSYDSKMEGAVGDYGDTNSVPCLLGNPDWEVLPSLAFVDGVPKVLTCRRHGDGSDGKHLFPPKSPNGVLPAPNADQLTPVVMRPRTVQQFKAHSYSDSYQMSEMRGQFGGVDTFHLTEQHNFGIESNLLDKSEALTINGRRDISVLAGDWCGSANDVLPGYVAEDMFRNAEQDKPDDDIVRSCCKAATYITLSDSMKLHDMNRQQQGRFVREEVDGQLTARHYVPLWPSALVNVHPCNEHGCDFPLFPSVNRKDSDNFLLWSLSGMLVSVPVMWEKTDEAVRDTAGWQGWLLSHLTHACFPKRKSQRGKRSGNPFKFETNFRSASRLDELLVKMGLRLPSSFPQDNGACSETFSLSDEAVSVEGDLDCEISVEEDQDVMSCGSSISDVVGEFSVSGTGEVASLSDDVDLGSVFSLPVDPAEQFEMVNVHADGCFHPEDMKKLLKGHRGVDVVLDTELEECNYSIAGKSRVVVLVNQSGGSNFPVDKLVLEDGSTLELRYVAGRHLDGQGPMFAYMRHGGGKFRKWWRQNSCLEQDQVGSAGLVADQRWYFATYVRDDSMSIEHCRDVMLKNMGIEKGVRCKHHDLPLITAPFHAKDGGRFCCSDDAGEACKGRLMCCCPVRGCRVSLCLQHKADVLAGRELVHVGGGSVDDSPMTQDSGQGSADGTSSSAKEEGASCEERDGMLDWLGPSLNSEPVVFRDFLEEDDVDSVEGNVFQTSNIETPLEIRGDPRSIPGCVLLNNVGSLLVRKRSKERVSANFQYFLQKMVATLPGRSVPLVYPEAMLFPSIFWKDDDDEGSLLGAIPCGALAHSTTLKKAGIADLVAQIRSRITNPALATSTDPRYLCYAFDVIVNLGCRHEDTRVVLHRGIVGTDNGIALRDSNTAHFNVDSVDSRPTVNKLAAAVAEKQATYFFTHTPNASDHFGLAPLREWLCSDEALVCNGADLSNPSGCEEIRTALKQSAAVVLLRNWIETAIIYMNYISDSEERPLGDVEHIWWRFEFQDAVGNLPHIHALLWLREGCEPAEVTEGRIRGSVMDLIRADEIDELVAEGLLSCADEAIEVQELAKRVLGHICNSRCQRRVGIEDGELRCRVTDNAFESSDSSRYVVREINVQHSDKACGVLEELGLFVEDPSGDGYIPVVDTLKATKHYPPADSWDGKMSACNGRLFTLTRSNQNLKIMTGYLASRYLAKYLALVDEGNRVYIGSMSRERNATTAEIETLHNTKITGSAIMEARRDAVKRDRKHPTGRALSHMEMICVILGYPQVYTNLEFVHIPTVPLEERPALERESPLGRLVKEGAVPDSARKKSPSDLDAGDVIPSWKFRNVDWAAELPAWRTWSDMESICLRDQCKCPLTLDAVSLFGVRPPELRWVQRPALYYRWFYRDTAEKVVGKTFKHRMDRLHQTLDSVYENCRWIDGTECAVYVREKAVPEILRYLDAGGGNGGARPHESFYARDMEIPTCGINRDVHVRDSRGHDYAVRAKVAETPYRDVYNLFRQIDMWQVTPPRLSRKDHIERWNDLQQRFFGPRQTKPEVQKFPVIWYNSVKPSEPMRWLLHLLLSMGEFDCEANLLATGNMVDNFVRARLLRSDLRHRQADVDSLIRRYIEEQLVYVPGGTYSFDRHVTKARDVLQAVMIENTMPPTPLPAGLYTHLLLSTNKACTKHREDAKHSLCNRLWEDVKATGMIDLPFSKTDLVHATALNPVYWAPSLRKTSVQSDDSYKEQTRFLERSITALVNYQDYVTRHPKGVVAAGGPGSGKTCCLELIGLIARSRGLNVGLATVMCERARQLGGIHFAQLCKFPGCKSTNPCRLAELAISRLMRSAKHLEYIRSLDVLLIDELGQVSAEMLSALDIIFRRVRNNSSFFGGMLVFASMDAMQLRPVEGRPPLVSPHMATCFDFVPLDHSVRAAHCPALRRLIEICRMKRSDLDSNLQKEFYDLITRHCTFVPDFDDQRLRPDMLRMFATHAARRDAESRLMTAIRRRYGGHLVQSDAVDREASVEGNWVKASSVTSRLLADHVKEPAEVYFYPRATYEVTFNKEGHFAQSQLAVLADVPTKAQVREMKPVRVYLAPEGTKSIPATLSSEEDFLQSGYRVEQVGQAPCRTQYIGLGFQAKRIQYGLRHRIAATIHAGMGQDLPVVITKVDGPKMYRLFQREQVVVLLSRTHYAKDIYFVGDPAETAKVLWEALNVQSQYGEYLSYLMDRLTGKTSSDGFKYSIELPYFHPCRPIDSGLPQDNSGYVYLLTSVAKGMVGKATYIGQTPNLAARYDKHLKGTATAQTADPSTRPWVLLAYVSGFEGCSKSGRMYFETLWQGARDRCNAVRNASCEVPLGADEVATLGKQLIDDASYLHCVDLQGKNLVFHRCGAIKNHPFDPRKEIP